MKPSNDFTQKFWENKILDWEESRYSSHAIRPGRFSFLEKIAAKSSTSLRFRQALAFEILRPRLQSARVIEVGCGSGLLAEKLIAAGAREYIGYDIAANAIERAQERIARQGLSSKIKFFRASVQEMFTQFPAPSSPPSLGDLVFSLGLMDWLSNDEIKHLFYWGRNAEFLHSFSEKRRSISQLVHRGYVHIAYGRKSAGYVPRYLSAQEVRNLGTELSLKKAEIYRDPRLSFGAFFSSVPFGHL